MKLRIFWSLAFFLSLTTCSVQKKKTFNAPLVTGVKETYTVRKSEVMNLKMVNNTKNSLPQSHIVSPDAAEPGPKDSWLDEKAIIKICKEIFSPERLKELSNDTDHVLVDFDLDHNANVLEISFAFKASSSITPQEIEQLETRLKKEVKATINDKAFRGHKYIILTRFLVFKRILNNEPNPLG